jgi:hypothetical protein
VALNTIERQVEGFVLVPRPSSLVLELGATGIRGTRRKDEDEDESEGGLMNERNHAV